MNWYNGIGCLTQLTQKYLNCRGHSQAGKNAKCLCYGPKKKQGSKEKVLFPTINNQRHMCLYVTAQRTPNGRQQKDRKTPKTNFTFYTLMVRITVKERKKPPE